MPKHGTQEVANILDTFYEAIFESGKTDTGRRYSGASIYSEIAGASTDRILFLPVHEHRVYGPLHQSANGDLFVTGYLPSTGDYVYYRDALFDYAGVNLVMRVDFTAHSALQIMASCPFDGASPASARWRLGKYANTGEWVVDFETTTSNRKRVLVNSHNPGPTTVVAFLARDRVGLSIDGDPMTFNSSGTDLPNNFPSGTSRVNLGASETGGALSRSPLRWAFLINGTPLSDEELLLFDDLPDDLVPSVPTPTKFEVLSLLTAFGTTLLQRFLFAWMCGGLDHTPLSAVGDGYIPADALAIPILGKTGAPTHIATDGQVALNWPDLTRATGYRVQWNSGAQSYLFHSTDHCHSERTRCWQPDEWRDLHLPCTWYCNWLYCWRMV